MMVNIRHLSLLNKLNDRASTSLQYCACGSLSQLALLRHSNYLVEATTGLHTSDKVRFYLTDNMP